MLERMWKLANWPGRAGSRNGGTEGGREGKRGERELHAERMWKFTTWRTIVKKKRLQNGTRNVDLCQTGSPRQSKTEKFHDSLLAHNAYRGQVK